MGYREPVASVEFALGRDPAIVLPRYYYFRAFSVPPGRLWQVRASNIPLRRAHQGGNAIPHQKGCKSGITRIYANQLETHQCEGQEDAEEEQGAVFESPARRNFDAIYDPVGREIQGRGDKREIDYLQRIVCKSGAHFPNAAIVRDQEDISGAVCKQTNGDNTGDLVQPGFHL